ncbi:MAG: phosphonate ABC transporter ATP-binding protein [Culicoidibacterales bacterium]
MMLEMTAVTKKYSHNHFALENVNVKIDKGEFVVVIGPSGAGKSTFLRSINKIIPLTSGSILFNQNEVTLLKSKELRKIRRQIGMVFQHYNLVEQLTVIENVLHGRLGYKTIVEGILGIYTDYEKQEAINLLKLLGIENKAEQKCWQLSGGQKQRVGIARALIQNPALILCDEPIASLDPNAAQKTMTYLAKVVRELNIACIVNLHQVEIAKQYADRIIGLNRGKIVFDGPVSQLTAANIRQIYEE